MAGYWQRLFCLHARRVLELLPTLRLRSCLFLSVRCSSAQAREALILVGASGFSYEEASRLCGCTVGTLKVRVSRARRQLAEILNG